MPSTVGAAAAAAADKTAAHAPVSEIAPVGEIFAARIVRAVDIAVENEGFAAPDFAPPGSGAQGSAA